MTAARFIQNQLKELQVQNIEYCSNGEEALASMRRCAPDLVASAMYLPDMMATDLIQQLRAESALEKVAFMLISSETAFSRLDPLRQAGIVAILPKPFSAEDMRRALVSTTRFIDTAEPELELSGLSELKILVVDDSMMARKYVCRILQNLGIESITEAENGVEAVEILQRNMFDMVFTDYNMPEMDGEQLTRYIREKSIQSTIPILMVTSEENGQRLAAVQQAGVSGICDKPFDTDTVLKMIQSICSNKAS